MYLNLFDGGHVAIVYIVLKRAAGVATVGGIKTFGCLMNLTDVASLNILSNVASNL